MSQWVYVVSQSHRCFYLCVSACGSMWAILQGRWSLLHTCLFSWEINLSDFLATWHRLYTLHIPQQPQWCLSGQTHAHMEGQSKINISSLSWVLSGRTGYWISLIFLNNQKKEFMVLLKWNKKFFLNSPLVALKRRPGVSLSVSRFQRVQIRRWSFTFSLRSRDESQTDQ